MAKIEWEEISSQKIEDCDSVVSDRLRIPKGWLVRTMMHSTRTNAETTSIHQIIVEDPDHTWSLKEEEENA